MSYLVHNVVATYGILLLLTVARTIFCNMSSDACKTAIWGFMDITHISEKFFKYS